MPIQPNIPAEITALSPQFVKVFAQAAAAEGYGLDEIAGVGFRKALEFLVKDFCIAETPDAADEIRSSFLGEVIKSHVEDANIQRCAQRAVWLGNDETHYERRWAGRDIEDLKVLIDLTVGWVRSNVLTRKYLTEMPAPGATK